MDDNADKDNPPPDFNKIDLSQLQGFSFGTQWTQDKSGASDKGGRGEPRPRRDDRREGAGDGGPDRRDRRSFRKPEGGPDHRAPAGPGRPPGGEIAGDRRPRFEPREFRGGPRPGGERGSHAGGRPGGHDRTPYDSPYFSITFYPEDTSFNALVKTIRASCRTIELFEIARTVLGKAERFTILITRRDPGAPAVPARLTPAERAAANAPAPAADAAAASPPAAAKAEPEKQPIYISIPDGVPFDKEEAAVAHALGLHLKLFFDSAEVEVDPPKGNFQVINRCGVTGELLGPPNYHRYNQMVQQHYNTKALRIPFEAYRSRIETVRDPEVVNQWLEKMKRITRYTWKPPAAAKTAPADKSAGAGADKAAPEKPAEEKPEAEQAAPETVPAAAPAAEAPPAAAEIPAPDAAPAEPAPMTFDSLEDARSYLLTQARDKLVRPAAHARFHGRELDKLPDGEIWRAIEGTLERQRRFPLDTANALRGRLRREHFTIFKKGAKGVSYVCAVKRKFRVPGQTFAESIGTLIAFIEAHPLVKAGELVRRFLGVAEESPAGPASGDPAALASVVSVEQREKIARMQGDLLWLVREGYVTEFIDGSLYAPPPMVEARKKQAEREENDPENFPEPTTPAEPAPAPEALPPPAEAQASVAEQPAPVGEGPGPGSEAPVHHAAAPVDGGEALVPAVEAEPAAAPAEAAPAIDPAAPPA